MNIQQITGCKLIDGIKHYQCLMSDCEQIWIPENDITQANDPAAVQLLNSIILPIQEQTNVVIDQPKVGGFEHGDTPNQILQVASLDDNTKIYVL